MDAHGCPLCAQCADGGSYISPPAWTTPPMMAATAAPTIGLTTTPLVCSTPTPTPLHAICDQVTVCVPNKWAGSEEDVVQVTGRPQPSEIPTPQPSVLLPWISLLSACQQSPLTFMGHTEPVYRLPSTSVLYCSIGLLGGGSLQKLHHQRVWPELPHQHTAQSVFSALSFPNAPFSELRDVQIPEHHCCIVLHYLARRNNKGKAEFPVPKMHVGAWAGPHENPAIGRERFLI